MTNFSPIFSINAVLAHLNTLLDDSANSRWSTTEKYQALAYACQRAWPEWFDVWIDESMLYDKNVSEYSLYNGMADVLSVHIIGATETRLITDWYVDGYTLYFPTSYSSLDGGTLRLTTITMPSILAGITFVDGTSSGVIVSASEKKVTFPPGNMLQSKGIQPGMTINMGGGTGAMVFGHFHIARVFSETVLYVIEPPSTDTMYAGGTIAMFTDLPVAYLSHMAAAYLLQHEGSPANNVDVETTLQWARFHYEVALMELKRWRKHYPPRRK